MQTPLLRQKGQSLLEILFAIAIFTIGFITIGYLLIDAEKALVRNIEFTEARLLSREGIEAVRTIRDRNFTDVNVGTYELVKDGNLWNLESVTPSDSKYTRTITIRKTEPGTREITSSVVWNDMHQVARNVALTAILTNWRVTDGDAELLQVDTSNAVLSETTEALTNISIQNTGLMPIVITSMILAWDNFNTLHQITVEGTDVFTIPTPPSDGLVSGASIDITDYTLGAFEGAKTIGQILFNGSMYGTDFLLTFVLGDGSERTVRVDF